ncbi:MAG: hypothetical protein ACR2KV_06140 [Solirubrobacteraceae bacterium]
MTLHIRPTAALAERAVLAEDPGDAMALAQALLERPLMFNHSRGLWGYTGLAADGRPLTVQSTGIGAPSAGVVLDELIALGLGRAIRVGTCAALDPDLELGELLIAGAALPPDAGAPVEADVDLTRLLATAAPAVRRGLVASADRFYDDDGETRWAGNDGGAAWRAAGAGALDLETAALLRLADRRGIGLACVLVVADLLAPPRRIGDEALAAATQRAGGLAAQALTP